MVNLLIIYDDQDMRRGEYFSSSNSSLLNKIKPGNISLLQLLDTKKCIELSIDNYTKNFNGNSFIFIAYSHGTEYSLDISDFQYVNRTNAYLFNSSLVYACSCLSAITLGQQLIEHGCKVFLGFNGTISSINPETEAIYQDCENSFIEHFINTESSVQECLSIMYEKYRKMEVHLSLYSTIFDAGILSKNLSKFQIICADEYKDLNKNSFQNSNNNLDI